MATTCTTFSARAAFEIVTYGPAAVTGDPDYRSTMPAYADVTSDYDDSIAVLSYIKHTWPG